MLPILRRGQDSPAGQRPRQLRWYRARLVVLGRRREVRDFYETSTVVPKCRCQQEPPMSRLPQEMAIYAISRWSEIMGCVACRGEGEGYGSW